MTSFLGGPLAKQIAQAFKGKLLVGTIRRQTVSSVNSAGDTVPGTDVDYTFTGLRDGFDARYRAQALIPETDVKVTVLLASVRPTQIVPTQADKININGSWHKIRRVLTIDPAGATQELQCYVVPS